MQATTLKSRNQHNINRGTCIFSCDLLHNTYIGVKLHVKMPHQLLCSLLHDIKHVPDAVTLLQALLMTFKFISEVFDNQPF